MCGIVGYFGKRNASEILVDGLRRMEYRGYDSAGVACLRDGVIGVVKNPGKIKGLREKVDASDLDSMQYAMLGIGHTRWSLLSFLQPRFAWCLGDLNFPLYRFPPQLPGVETASPEGKAVCRASVIHLRKNAFPSGEALLHQSSRHNSKMGHQYFPLPLVGRGPYED